LNTFILHWVH